MKNKLGHMLALFVGLVLICAAGMHAYVNAHVSLLDIGIGIVGILMVGGVLIRERQRLFRNLLVAGWHKFVWGLLTGLAVMALWVSSNVMVSRLDMQWDMTSARQHTLHPQTIKLIGQISDEVNITLLITGAVPKYISDMLREFQKVSKGKINYEFIDPIAQIGLAAQFGNIIKADESKVILRSGKRQKDFTFTGMNLNEEQLANALVQLSSNERIVYFLEGHGEYSIDDVKDQGLSAFKSLLATSNYKSKTLLLDNAGIIPADCSLLVIPGARRNLSAKEVGLLNDYLGQGGRAFFLVESVLITTPDKPLSEQELALNPSLNELLEPWGFHINDDVVVDLVSHAGDDVGSPATKNYKKHKALIGGLDYTFYVRPRSIQFSDINRPKLKRAAFALTASSDKSWGETNRMLQVHFDQGIDVPGPVPISVVAWEQKDNKDAADTRFAVFTDADFLSNAYINYYSNAQMGINVVNWLTESDYLSYLGEKNVALHQLDLTSQQKRIIGAILVLLPMIIVIVGVLMWFSTLA